MKLQKFWGVQDSKENEWVITSLARSVWTQTQTLNSTLSAEYSGSRTYQVPPVGKGLVDGSSVVTGVLTDQGLWCAAQSLPAWTGGSGSPRHPGCDVVLLNSISGSSFLVLVLLVVRCFAGNLKAALRLAKLVTQKKLFPLETKMGIDQNLKGQPSSSGGITKTLVRGPTEAESRL